MSKRRIGIAVTVLGAALAAVWFLSFLSTPPPPEPDDGAVAATRFSQPHFVKYKRGGEREWSLRAEVVEEATDGSGTVQFENITEGILFEDDREKFSFVAERGTLTEERDLHLTGDVTFYEDGEVVFESQEVIWQASTETVVVPGAVTAHYDGQSIAADRLLARLKEDTVELSGNVVWVTEDGVEVRAERAYYVDDRLEFTGESQPVRLRLEKESST